MLKARLGPMRAKLGQEIELACLDGPAWFYNRAWQGEPKTGRASPGRAGLGWATHLAISRQDVIRSQDLPARDSLPGGPVSSDSSTNLRFQRGRGRTCPISTVWPRIESFSLV
jgi:hypothetical protein